jgi:hypothetical protein
VQLISPPQAQVSTDNAGAVLRGALEDPDLAQRLCLYVQDARQVRLEEQQFTVAPMYLDGMEKMKVQADVSQYISTFARNNTGLYSAWLPLLASNIDLFQDVSDVYEKLTLYANQLVETEDNYRVDAEFSNYLVKGKTNMAVSTPNLDALPFYYNDDKNVIVNKVSLGWMMSRLNRINGNLPAAGSALERYIGGQDVVIIPILGQEQVPWAYVMAHLRYPWIIRTTTQRMVWKDEAGAVETTGVPYSGCVVLGKVRKNVILVDVLDQSISNWDTTVLFDDGTQQYGTNAAHVVDRDWRYNFDDIIEAWRYASRVYPHTPSMVNGFKRAIARSCFQQSAYYIKNNTDNTSTMVGCGLSECTNVSDAIYLYRNKKTMWGEAIGCYRVVEDEYSFEEGVRTIPQGYTHESGGWLRLALANRAIVSVISRDVITRQGTLICNNIHWFRNQIYMMKYACCVQSYNLSQIYGHLGFTDTNIFDTETDNRPQRNNFEMIYSTIAPLVMGDFPADITSSAMVAKYQPVIGTPAAGAAEGDAAFIADRACILQVSSQVIAMFFDKDQKIYNVMKLLHEKGKEFRTVATNVVEQAIVIKDIRTVDKEDVTGGLWTFGGLFLTTLGVAARANFTWTPDYTQGFVKYLRLNGSSPSEMLDPQCNGHMISDVGNNTTSNGWIKSVNCSGMTTSYWTNGTLQNRDVAVKLTVGPGYRNMPEFVSCTSTLSKISANLGNANIADVIDELF